MSGRPCYYSYSRLAALSYGLAVKKFCHPDQTRQHQLADVINDDDGHSIVRFAAGLVIVFLGL